MSRDTTFHALILTAALAAVSMTAQADVKYDKSLPVNPAATESYAQSAKCLSSISVLQRFNENLFNMSMAMLGRLPACEVAKIVEAMGIERVNMLNRQ